MPSPGSSRDAPAPPTGTAAEEFSVFYRTNYQSALNLVRCRIEGDSEAVVADSFLATWQHLQLTGELSRGWLFGVIRNKIGDHYRSAQRREASTAELDLIPATQDSTNQSDARIDASRILKALPATYSEPLILAYWCDLSGTEAARALGVREGTLRVRLHRAHRAFLKEADRQARAETVAQEGVTPWTVQRG